MVDSRQRLYIDINAGTGRTSYWREGFSHDTSSLLMDMKYYRVHASAVYSNVSRDYSFVKGNKQLIEQVHTNDRLYGIAAVVPHLQYELEDGFSYIDRLLENGIRGLKKTQHFP